MNHTTHAALQVLYNLARDDQPADLSLLAEKLGVSCVQADMLLAALDRAGLVDADKVRLTLTGLTIAVSTDARRSQRATERRPRRAASRAA